MKQCFKCGISKPRDEFYPHPAMGDGLLGKCKECTKADARAVRKNKIEYYREYDSKRFREDPARRAYVFARAPGYRKDNPEKYRAHSLVNSAINCGRLKKKPCERCGSLLVHGHHEDYAKPLEVIWLCAIHHAERHKEIDAERAAEAACTAPS